MIFLFLPVYPPQSSLPHNAHRHTQAHTIHMHTCLCVHCTHAHSHTRTHTQCLHTCTAPHSCTHEHIYVYCPYTCIHAHTIPPRVHTQAHIHPHVHICPHIHGACTHTFTCMHACMSTCAYIYDTAQRYTHEHTYTFPHVLGKKRQTPRRTKESARFLNAGVFLVVVAEWAFSVVLFLNTEQNQPS